MGNVRLQGVGGRRGLILYSGYLLKYMALDLNILSFIQIFPNVTYEPSDQLSVAFGGTFVNKTDIEIRKNSQLGRKVENQKPRLALTVKQSLLSYQRKFQLISAPLFSAKV